jgi:ABC-type transport system involved in cytochrome c biogenesis permease subunit
LLQALRSFTKFTAFLIFIIGKILFIKAQGAMIKLLFLNVKLRVLLLAGLILSGGAFASAQAVCPLDSLTPRGVSSLEVFRRIPVLNDGRIKPMDSYARGFLFQVSGRRSYRKESALEWFSRFLFAPRTTYDDKIFLINHPEIPEALKIEPDKRRRYSYRQLEPGYDKFQELALAANDLDDQNRSRVDREILRVYSNLRLYIRLSGALTYAFPHPDFTIESPVVRSLLQLPEEITQFSFYDIASQSGLLFAALDRARAGEFEEGPQVQQRLAGLAESLYFWTDHYSQTPFGLIPVKDHQDEHWLSPMDIIRAGGMGDPVYGPEIKIIRDMMESYWNGLQLEFDLGGRRFIDAVGKRLSPKEAEAAARIPLEIFYNRLNLFTWVKLLYGAVLLLFLCSFRARGRWLFRLAFALTVLGFALHNGAVILRMMIMSRPPVTNLFETFVFVALISVALGIFLAVINKNWLGIVTAGICGLGFLLFSLKFNADGSSMQMLVAVLDSNFWLSVHVITITMGYAGCVVAGILGHVYILQALARPGEARGLDVIYKNMLGTLGFGLTLTFLGTALGGIWADQSWGRFWGWDPKENGALLIVLWCAIIMHARIGKIIHPLGVAVGCILGLIVVVWAWVGVNLLSVGLHSYGFTSGVANTLVIYVVVEILFIAVTVPLLGKKNFKF